MQRLREVQDSWVVRKAEEIQGLAYSNASKNFTAIKAIYEPPPKGTAPLLSSEGSTLLAEKSKILKRWAEHLRSVFNRLSTIYDFPIDRLPQKWNQHRPGPPVLSPRNHPRPATNLPRESPRIQCDPN
ncbi:hypothetical protein SprV_0501866400 [Sparganum proliferum]